MNCKPTYTCRVCDDVFAVRRQFHQHLAEGHNIYDQCGECKHSSTLMLGADFKVLENQCQCRSGNDLGCHIAATLIAATHNLSKTTDQIEHSMFLK